MMGFLRGVLYGLDGARWVLVTPRLWKLLALPFVLSLVVFAAVAVLVVKLAGWPWLLAVPVAALFLYLPVASIIAGPFNEAIAETVEERSTGRAPGKTSAATMVRDVGLTIAHETRKFLKWLALSAAVLALSLLVPVVGTVIGAVGGWLIAARFAAYDALDATFSRWGWSYAEKVAFLQKRRALTTGLGALVAVGMLLPGVGAVGMGIGAAGGALLACREAPRPAEL